MTAPGDAWVSPHTTSSWKCCIRWLLSVAVLPLQVSRCKADKKRRQEKDKSARASAHHFLLPGMKNEGGGSVITSVHRASPWDRGAVLSKMKKTEKGMIQENNWQHVFHRYNGTVSHPSTDWVVLSLPITATVFPPLGFYPAFLNISIPHWSFRVKFSFPFSCLQLFPTLPSYLTPPSISFSSLCVSHALRFFLFFVSSLPWCFSACQDMHSRAERESGGRERREGGPVAVSDSTVDRWEGLPGVKVQSNILSF